MKALQLLEARKRFISGDHSKRSWMDYLNEVTRIKAARS